jgi:hypothetical protein
VPWVCDWRNGGAGRSGMGGAGAREGMLGLCDERGTTGRRRGGVTVEAGWRLMEAGWRMGRDRL